MERAVLTDRRRAHAGGLLSDLSDDDGPLPRAGRLIDVLSVLLPARAIRRCRTDADVPHARIRPRRQRGDRPRVANAVAGRAKRLVDALGLAARTDVASDPFFGRAGALLADSQRNQQLKLEILAPVANPASLTAVILSQLSPDSFRRALRHRRRRRHDWRTPRVSDSASNG